MDRRQPPQSPPESSMDADATSAPLTAQLAAASVCSPSLSYLELPVRIRGIMMEPGDSLDGQRSISSSSMSYLDPATTPIRAIMEPGDSRAGQRSISSSSMSYLEPPTLCNLTRIRVILEGGFHRAGDHVVVGGWVKTGRQQGKGDFAFLEVNDGSCLENLQVMVEKDVHPLARLTHTGTSVLVEGVLQNPPVGAKQSIELKVKKVIEVGEVDAAAYPLPKTKLNLETLRDFVHLRARTNMIGAVARIRHHLAYATHTFFFEREFLYVHTPIITTSDCEGAGEMFQVTSLFSQAEKVEKELKENPAASEADIEAYKLAVEGKGGAVAQLKAAKASKQEITAAVSELRKAKDNFLTLVERSKLKPGIPHKDDGTIAFENDFFKRQAFLTVSGQLQVETYACALGNVYTFGPTFRAENSHTSRHLAEFWMVEPEIAYANLHDDMDYAEYYVKYLCRWLLSYCREDMEFMVKHVDKTAIERLVLVSSAPFERISYTEAVEILQGTDMKFENKVEWGIDLASEHERYLTEMIFKKPVIVYNYPKEIKAFYMRINDDQKTVAAMDVLVPKVGELIGGSQREERLDVLKQRILDAGLSLEPYQWYMDLRRFGTVKHSGFGLGFERMILFATGLENIRDVIPFPRYPGRADL